MTEAEPDELIERASRGDAGAIDALLVRHLPALHAFVRLRARGAFGGRESSSDVVQSVCREVLLRADEYRHRDEAGFKNWLFTAAANKVVDRHRFHHRGVRDRGREVPLSGGPQDGSDVGPGVAELAAPYASLGTPSQLLMQREDLLRLEAAFAELPEAQQEVIALSRIAGLTYAEIAAQTDRTEVAVRGLVARGLVKLAALVDRARSADAD